MRVLADWRLCDDGITRPVALAQVMSSDGTLMVDNFLVDSGADRTVFSAELLQRLGFLSDGLVPDSWVLQGVGGVGESILVKTSCPSDQGKL